jgi:hypothetical protein
MGLKHTPYSSVGLSHFESYSNLINCNQRKTLVKSQEVNWVRKGQINKEKGITSESQHLRTFCCLDFPQHIWVNHRFDNIYRTFWEQHTCCPHQSSSVSKDSCNRKDCFQKSQRARNGSVRLCHFQITELGGKCYSILYLGRCHSNSLLL